MRLLFLRSLACKPLALLALLGGSLPAGAAPPPGPAGLAFYEPPPLGAGTHGDLIWSRALDGSAALPSAARNELILYRTTSVGGTDVAVSGVVSLPKGRPPAGGWPVITWTHGTTGDAPACAPSRDRPGGPMSTYLGQADLMLDDFVAHGYAVVQTDYEGQGTPGVHPFLVGEAEARDAVDIVRAARRLEPQLGSRYVVAGHSQGGHSALFVAALGAAWAPELHELGAVALAPASQFGPWIASLAEDDTPTYGLGFAALLVRGYAATYPGISLDRIWAAGTAPYEAQLGSRCILGLFRSDSWAKLVPARAFVPKPDLAALNAAMASNDPGTLRIGLPVLLVQGTGDDIVAPSATDRLDDELCARNVAVSYDAVADADHVGLLSQTIGTVRAWIDDRFAGTPAVANCDKPPKAGM